ncbi:MAG TPA: ABC transporter ATP-binding protein [Chloroflexota bacterium]|nr:ABC transporter ATP-binding protein [Chloroflexota bacterium]
MTAPVAISVRQVDKRYRLYRRQSDRLLEWLTRRPRHRPFWALRGVSFDIHRGEIVGVIGRNGAGKSTLLRLLAGISPPTAGEIDVNYRMSVILELGSGFHPDFTGRENVFLGGAVLGMDEAEIRRKYEGIVAFSELEAYMDLPFKTYSLGMQARLSFAVAISVDPEILIIDEALAAGDSAFIAKCFERIRQICASGSTVLFVSHNTYLVQRLCGRALWIDSGRLVADGHPSVVCRDYEAALRRHDQEQRATRPAERRRFSDHDDATLEPSPPPVSHVWGTGELRFTDVELLDADGHPASTVYAGERLTIRLTYEGHAPYDDLAVIILVTREDGVPACSLDAREAGLVIPALQGRGTFEVSLEPLLLGRGRYFVSPHIYRDRSGVPGADDVLVYHDRLYEFVVERRGRPYDVAVEQPATWTHGVNTRSQPSADLEHRRAEAR